MWQHGQVRQEGTAPQRPLIATKVHSRAQQHVLTYTAVRDKGLTQTAEGRGSKGERVSRLKLVPASLFHHSINHQDSTKQSSNRSSNRATASCVCTCCATSATCPLTSLPLPDPTASISPVGQHNTHNRALGQDQQAKASMRDGRDMDTYRHIWMYIHI